MVKNGNPLLWAKPIEGMAIGKETSGGVTYGLGEAGYDIRIKQEITFYCFLWLLPLIKVTDGDRSKWFFGRFVLASAVEKFRMPSDLVGIVHDKSSWARRALSVFNTVIEPGWKGYLTLELVFHGRKTVKIPAGSGIAQVLFHTLNEKRTYEGRYQDQADRPVEAKSVVS
ncbi:deoxycytidine triphosphate deaminase [Pseudomonas phage inbricus]|uniref:Deoxycytidine triphosphate deaminase n=1 Tax=Pseudomonas phage inbricus TaxID=2048976 RepID=A0A2H4P7K8_9CAUD|nr:dCTP deaminase [Pseudomonas phage inbricus]ATW58166.1 deoxycytidine triphosphate deaminase [Pseudomonas phage inbricus]